LITTVDIPENGIGIRPGATTLAVMPISRGQPANPAWPAHRLPLGQVRGYTGAFSAETRP
jgi:hypothetical protein